MTQFRQTMVALALMVAWSFGFGGEKPASANWFSWGSNGSSGGSGGSSGGAWGSHGSSGGSWGDSWGSNGSSGGSWGWNGSSGGSWGSHGSSGGSWGSSGGYYTQPAPQVSVALAGANVAYLNVNVPVNAQVYLQGQRMGLSGARRRFVTPDLGDGRQHVYTVRVDVERNGRRISKTVEALVKSGQEVEVTVAFDPQSPNDLVAR